MRMSRWAAVGAATLAIAGAGSAAAVAYADDVPLPEPNCWASIDPIGVEDGFMKVRARAWCDQVVNEIMVNVILTGYDGETERELGTRGTPFKFTSSSGTVTLSVKCDGVNPNFWIKGTGDIDVTHPVPGGEGTTGLGFLVYTNNNGFQDDPC